MNNALLTKSVCLLLAVFMTAALLDVIDTLAYDQHAAVQMARAASAPATTAERRPVSDEGHI